MSLIPAWLREACKLQVQPELCMGIELTCPFGRAHIFIGEDQHPGGWIAMYWLCLPSYEYRRGDYGRRFSWQQRVLMWDGSRGFTVQWRPAQDRWRD